MLTLKMNQGKVVCSMDDKHNMQKGKYNGNGLLLTVLIGFCILAIVEILYGQAQIRMEKERLALEEENHQTVQQLKEDWENLKNSPNANTETVGIVNEGQSGGTESDNVPINTEDGPSDAASVQNPESEGSAETDKQYAMQIVVLGDSIMADQRENNEDVPTLIGQACNAKVYNMAIGGTTAALLTEEKYDYENWSSMGLLGVVNAIVGNIDGTIFEGYETWNVLNECDFSKTDYFVIEYGLNDFISKDVIQSKYLADGEILDIDVTHTYVGALESAVTLLHGKYPNAKIMLISPHYCQFYDGDTYVGNSYSLNYGKGSLIDFFGTASYVANEHREDNVLFFNAMQDSEIDAYTADELLEDGIHLSNRGRRVYADHIAERINADFYRAE